MDINNKARIHWACRRGMRELDISIMPFFEHEYDSLSDDEKRIFIRLLECDDPDLFNWLMNHGKPADAELEMMVRLIQTRNRERGPVQSDLRVSWRAQWLSLLIHGLVAAVILLMPWPLSYTPLWMVLLSLVVFDCVRSQRRINARQGEIRLLMDGRLRWQGQEWSIVKAPWMIKSGMMLRLRSDSGKRQHLWLAADSMDEAEWRDLRRILLQQETQR